MIGAPEPSPSRPSRRIVTGVAAGLLLAGSVLWLTLLVGARHDASRPSAVERAPASEPAPGALAAAPPARAAIPRLGGTTTQAEGPTGALAALAGDDPAAAREAAVALRRAARTDARALAELAAALLDEATAPALRARLAVVLGTIDDPRVDGWLLATADRFAAEPGVLAAVLLALGAQRTPPDDDEVFDLADRPFGAAGPGGLGVTVRRRLEEEGTRRAAAARLAHPDEAVRYAAARALAQSLAFDDARTAARAALAAEATDAVAARLAEPLGAWAATAPAGLERDGVLVALVDRALAEGADETRFRLEKDLARSPLPPAAWNRLATATDPSSPQAVRAFALAVLPAAGAASGPHALAEARDRLAVCLERDAEPWARDAAARGLGTLPTDAGTVGALARHRADPRAGEALTAAASDPDPAVRDEARKALAEPRRDR